jgi:hypothetical protein
MNNIGQTLWKYATWLQRLRDVLQRRYFDSLPMNKYKGHNLLSPKDERLVESDQNIKAATTRGTLHPGSGGVF